MKPKSEAAARDTSIDAMTARLAGAVCGDLLSVPSFKELCLILSAGISFKVRTCLIKNIDSSGHVRDNSTLIRDIQNAVISLLFLYEFDALVVSAVAPRIETAIRKAIEN